MNERTTEYRHDHPTIMRNFAIRRLPASAGAIKPALPVKVEHIEVVQSVQNKQNSVPLSAGKETLVRIYLDTRELADGTPVHGELGVRKPDGGEVFVPAIEAQLISPRHRVGLRERRRELSGSLNFLLPSTVASGKRLLRISRIEVGNGVPIPIVDSLFPLLFVRCPPPFGSKRSACVIRTWEGPTRRRPRISLRSAHT